MVRVFRNRKSDAEEQMLREVLTKEYGSVKAAEINNWACYFVAGLQYDALRTGGVLKQLYKKVLSTVSSVSSSLPSSSSSSWSSSH